jgi:aminoglycoside phosphotransferase (APT) family kinase protein
VIRDADVVAQRLAAWLALTLPETDAVEILSVTIPKQGFSNETWFVDAIIRAGSVTSNRDFVVRVQPESSRLFLDADVMLQWRMMKAMSRHGVPTPPLVAADPEGTVVGMPMFVMEKVQGRIPSDLPPYNLVGWMTELPPTQRSAVWENGLSALAEIHRVDWRESCQFLDDPSRGEPGLDQYLHWIEQWHDTARAEREVPLLAAAVRRLRAAAPTRPSLGVVWGDARPGNIIYTDDLRVAAVLDWEMAALGPPEVDLAWWLFMDRFYSEGFETETLPGLPTRDETVRTYERFAARSIENLPYYELLAATRMAIIVSRSTASHVRAGRLDQATTMDMGNPAMRIVAELMGVDVPDLSSDFVAIIRAVTQQRA